MDVISILAGLTREIWHIVENASPYILFGIFISGIIQAFMDKDKIALYLGARGIRSVILSGLWGIPLPLCSCGVIPTAVSLRKNGASRGATLSFLIATPESSVDSIAVSYALLDPIMTIFRPVAAFVTAIVAGITENMFGRRDKETGTQKKDSCASCGKEGAHKHAFTHRLKYGMYYAFVDLLKDISKWLTLGLVIAGVISYFVPPDIVGKYLGYDWQAMLIMLVIGIPLYICATASTPIAAALIAKGMSPGVAFVFLLAGPATNIAGILTMGKFLGRRSIFIYLASISVCAILLGLLLNQIYLISGIDIKATLGGAIHIIPRHIKTASSISLILLILNSIRLAKRR